MWWLWIMKVWWFPVFMLLLSTSFSQELLDTTLCLFKHGDYLEYPGNCSKFIHCSHGRVYVFHCPATLQWNRDLMTCDYAENVKCSLGGVHEGAEAKRAVKRDTSKQENELKLSLNSPSEWELSQEMKQSLEIKGNEGGRMNCTRDKKILGDNKENPKSPHKEESTVFAGASFNINSSLQIITMEPSTDVKLDIKIISVNLTEDAENSQRPFEANLSNLSEEETFETTPNTQATILQAIPNVDIDFMITSVNLTDSLTEIFANSHSPYDNKNTELREDLSKRSSSNEITALELSTDANIQFINITANLTEVTETFESPHEANLSTLKENTTFETLAYFQTTTLEPSTNVEIEFATNSVNITEVTETSPRPYEVETTTITLDSFKMSSNSHINPLELTADVNIDIMDISVNLTEVTETSQGPLEANSSTLSEEETFETLSYIQTTTLKPSTDLDIEFINSSVNLTDIAETTKSSYVEETTTLIGRPENIHYITEITTLEPSTDVNMDFLNNSVKLTEATDSTQTPLEVESTTPAIEPYGTLSQAEITKLKSDNGEDTMRLNVSVNLTEVLFQDVIKFTESAQSTYESDTSIASEETFQALSNKITTLEPSTDKELNLLKTSVNLTEMLFHERTKFTETTQSLLSNNEITTLETTTELLFALITEFTETKQNTFEGDISTFAQETYKTLPYDEITTLEPSTVKETHRLKASVNLTELLFANKSEFTETEQRLLPNTEITTLEPITELTEFTETTQSQYEGDISTLAEENFHTLSNNEITTLAPSTDKEKHRLKNSVNLTELVFNGKSEVTEAEPGLLSNTEITTLEPITELTEAIQSQYEGDISTLSEEDFKTLPNDKITTLVPSTDKEMHRLKTSVNLTELLFENKSELTDTEQNILPNNEITNLESITELTEFTKTTQSRYEEDTSMTTEEIYKTLANTETTTLETAIDEEISPVKLSVNLTELLHTAETPFTTSSNEVENTILTNTETTTMETAIDEEISTLEVSVNLTELLHTRQISFTTSSYEIENTTLAYTETTTLETPSDEEISILEVSVTLTELLHTGETSFTTISYEVEDTTHMEDQMQTTFNDSENMLTKMLLTEVKWGTTTESIEEQQFPSGKENNVNTTTNLTAMLSTDDMATTVTATEYTMLKEETTSIIENKFENVTQLLITEMDNGSLTEIVATTLTATEYVMLTEESTDAVKSDKSKTKFNSDAMLTHMLLTETNDKLPTKAVTETTTTKFTNNEEKNVETTTLTPLLLTSATAENVPLTVKPTATPQEVIVATQEPINIFAEFKTSPDPRLPFRSIHCQGENNQQKLPANKCYRYYQCYAGWAFLLNCKDNYVFDVNLGECKRDVNKECYQ
ncbi:uncharacterized protein isoform X3 [Musca autumnalis]|uniref:uncharacterized protein isoform X3 n=1 Tax=Musca autumnalis TaxID=221902 RepID=UPI003CFB8663